VKPVSTRKYHRGGRRVRTYSVPDETDALIRTYAAEHEMTLSAVVERAIRRLTRAKKPST